MTQIIPGPITPSNGFQVDAYELHEDGEASRVVCLAICQITGSASDVRALVEMCALDARELAFELINLADLIEGECHLRRVNARAVLS